ncbi:hypothetical protein GIB67_006001 [Kingdonia uniflora]|uniref:Protein BIG GRAIN 1-like B n=1 Tax=Kingdonia uniflora TaxID=39325 RepID=A0A7J7MBT9_9MAGN|nr:hypothetical protein GIB67_035581 [Kingdonia uniflora]KAF6152347.1 hypothetical protein GIB67_006001 [Kingdonia uniflora]
MDHWKRDEKSKNHRRKDSSFSSALLDTIYRSFDEGETEDLLLTMKKTTKQCNNNSAVRSGANHSVKKIEVEEFANYKRTCLIEKYMMEKKVMTCQSETTVVRATRKSGSVPDFVKKSGNDSSKVFHSTSSSSDSSCGGGFSSSEAESLYGNSSYRPKPIRPIRTTVPISCSSDKYETTYRNNNSSNNNNDHKNKMKSRALKIYGDLKKVKQPISPGGKLATFLNSLFHTPKRSKIVTETKSAQTSTCSSASSFSRSCLSKTPSSSNRSSINGVKRTVRFYPVSVIVDEDCRPCGQKSLFEGDPPRNRNQSYQTDFSARDFNTFRDIYEVEALKFEREERKKKFEEIARDIAMRDVVYDDEDDDDVASCTSSDLFELDNLSPIRIERYREELPVYETTHLSGIIL